MLSMFTICSLLLLLIQVAIVWVEGSGTLEIRMNSFLNPTELLEDGTCCDVLCISECDDIFHFALDQSSGDTSNSESYYYWKKDTGVYQNQNNVKFKDDMKGVRNPIIWDFDTWPGSVLFKVFIEDDDTGFSPNDRLDQMIQRLTLIPSRSKSVVTTITIQGTRPRDKTTLSISYKLYCSDNFYGPACAVYCVEQDSNDRGHYTCDPDTGSKICRPGYEDVSTNCVTLSDDCIENRCKNGRCIDGMRSYSCSCADGYTGEYCDTNINECESHPCQNGGTCSDLINAFTCSCTFGFVGPQCAQTACSQADLCENGGTCYGNQQCLCVQGFVGAKCEMKTCEAVPCANGGTCLSNSTCLCTPEFHGNQCEVLKCELVSEHCKNGGSCVNGVCVCQDPYYGTSCEKIGCSKDTCRNGGICNLTNDGIGYECKCPSNYTGSTCQSPATSGFASPDQQPIINDISIYEDVSIFRGDTGALLIALIVLCIIFFIIIIVLIAFICYRRRRNRLYEKKRAASTTSTSTIISTVNESVVTPRFENLYSANSQDDVFCGHSTLSGESWKKLGCSECDEKMENTANNSRMESDYEKLDQLAEQTEMTAPEPPERFTCKIKDIHGESIRIAEKMADC